MIPKNYTPGDETWLRVGDVVNEAGRKFKVVSFTWTQPEDPEDEATHVADVQEWNGTAWADSAVKLDPQHGGILNG